jgi:hypothetical protein
MLMDIYAKVSLWCPYPFCETEDLKGNYNWKLTSENKKHFPKGTVNFNVKLVLSVFYQVVNKVLHIYYFLLQNQ